MPNFDNQQYGYNSDGQPQINDEIQDHQGEFQQQQFINNVGNLIQ
jgi:hypothetical protein